MVPTALLVSLFSLKSEYGTFWLLVTEGIFHTVPMIGMPIEFDQPDNMAFLMDKGAAEPISIWDDDSKILATVNRVLKGA